MSFERNPHDDLAPTMSALIIIAHVKEGVDLALKYKLHQRIIDIIQEHHGTSLVYYLDRKSTRLNSSHRCISYAVFCLKKKKVFKSIVTLHVDREPPPPAKQAILLPLLAYTTGCRASDLRHRLDVCARSAYCRVPSECR